MLDIVFSGWFQLNWEDEPNFIGATPFLPTLRQHRSSLKLISAQSGQHSTRNEKSSKFLRFAKLWSCQSCHRSKKICEPLLESWIVIFGWCCVISVINIIFKRWWSEWVWDQNTETNSAMTWTNFWKKARRKINSLKNIMMMMMATWQTTLDV